MRSRRNCVRCWGPTRIGDGDGSANFALDGRRSRRRRGRSCVSGAQAARRRRNLGVLPRHRRRVATNHRSRRPDSPRASRRASPRSRRCSPRYRGRATGCPSPGRSAATVAAVMVVGWVAVSTLDPQPTALARARAKHPRFAARREARNAFRPTTCSRTRSIRRRRRFRASGRTCARCPPVLRMAGRDRAHLTTATG